MSISQPLKWHGGKFYLANLIQEVASPYHWKKKEGGWLHRVIPYAGGLGEFWNWDCEGVSEVINDLDGALINFYEVLRDPKLFSQFRLLCELTPFGEPSWNMQPKDDKPVTLAHQFFINVRQSMAGRRDCFTPLSRTRLRRNMNEQVSAWLNAVEGLDQVHQRLRRVVVYCMDALSLIRKEDGARTLFYLDPPYLSETRTAPRIYLHEMSREDHESLLRLITSLEGFVLLSGYESELYEDYLAGWNKVVVEVPNHSGTGKTKQERREVLWNNFNTRNC